MLSLKEEVGVAARVLSAVTRFFSPPEANFSSPPNRSDYAAQVAVADTQRSAVLNQEVSGMLMVAVQNRTGFRCWFYKHSYVLKLHSLHQ